MARVNTADSASLVNRELTRFYDKGVDWVLATGPRLLLAAVIVALGLWLIRIARRTLNKKMGTHDVHSSLRPFIESLVFAVLHVALGFLVLQILGIRLTVFAAVIAAFGAAAGLALSGTLQNFASGVLILLLKPFKVGDNIVAQGEQGTVSSIQIFYTVITTFDNRTVVMPNSKLSNEVIVNITHEGVRRLDLKIKTKDSLPLDVVKKALTSALSEVPEALKDPAVRIGISEIDDSNYTVICNVWVNAHGFEDSKLLINERIVVALQAVKDAKKIDQ